jgi:hypothetical protein
VGFKLLFIHLKQTAMSNAHKSVLDVIKSIHDLEIKVYDDEDKVTFSGFLKDKSTIIVEIHLSIAPSLQSMLSRMGRVTATLWIKVNGNTAVYDSAMSSVDMKEVGGFLSDCDRKVQDQLDREAEVTLMNNLNNI